MQEIYSTEVNAIASLRSQLHFVTLERTFTLVVADYSVVRVVVVAERVAVADSMVAFCGFHQFCLSWGVCPVGVDFQRDFFYLLPFRRPVIAEGVIFAGGADKHHNELFLSDIAIHDI